MATFRKKLAVVILVVAIPALGVFWYWKTNKEEPFVPRDLDTVAGELKSPKQLEKYIGQLTEAYKKDFDGGDTPEETLNLFIAALKAGDTDLAAKYFMLEKQEKMRGELQAGKTSGGVSLLLKTFEKERKGYYLSTDKTKYEFATYDSTNTVEFTYTFILNTHTHKWKIESL